MSLHKVWLIARREFVYNFRRRSFLFTAFILPILVAAIMVIILVVVGQAEGDLSAYHHIGIVDLAGIFTAEPSSSSQAQANALPAPFELMAGEDQARAALQDNNLQGYYVLREDFLTTGRIDAYNHPDLGLSDALGTELQSVVKDAMAARVADPGLAGRISNPLDKLTIYRVGTHEPVDVAALVAVFLVPILLTVLLFISINATSQFLMSGLVDEKENRMMEIFLTSARLPEILWGKLIGLGALGIAQVGIWGIYGLIFALLQGNLDIGRALASLQLTPSYLLLFVAYFLLGYLMYGAIMFAVGVSVNAEQESRQLGGVVGLVTVLPFIFMFAYMTDPGGPLPVFFSLFPLTAPSGMLLRYAWSYVSPGQIALSLLLLVAFIFLVLRLAVFMFRLGALNYGKRLSIRDLISNLRYGTRQA